MEKNWLEVYIGMGSNLQNPLWQVQTAIHRLAALPSSKLLAVSTLYWSKPLGNKLQPDYVNGVARMQSGLTPKALLLQLQAIEQEQGRVRSGERWPSRSLDLDILLYGNECIQESDLTIPHPGIAKRAFVLLPLLELNENLSVPGLGALLKLKSNFSESQLRPVKTHG